MPRGEYMSEGLTFKSSLVSASGSLGMDDLCFLSITSNARQQRVNGQLNRQNVKRSRTRQDKLHDPFAHKLDYDTLIILIIFELKRHIIGMF